MLPNVVSSAKLDTVMFLELSSLQCSSSVKTWTSGLIVQLRMIRYGRTVIEKLVDARVISLWQFAQPNLE